MFTFLLPRCEHCDKRLGAEHNAESCARTVASRPSRRFFLMGALGSAAALILPVAHSLPLIGRGKFQLTPESIALADTVEATLGSSALAAAMRAEWLKKFPWKSVPRDERIATWKAKWQEDRDRWASQPITIQTPAGSWQVLQRRQEHEAANALLAKMRAMYP